MMASADTTATAVASLPMLETSPLAGEPIDRSDAERLAGVLKALADPARLRLLSLIQSAPESEACACDLTAPSGLSQRTVSHHLRILTEAGLLEREKRGVWAYYRLTPTAIGTIADLLQPPRRRRVRRSPPSEPAASSQWDDLRQMREVETLIEACSVGTDGARAVASRARASSVKAVMARLELSKDEPTDSRKVEPARSRSYNQTPQTSRTPQPHWVPKRGEDCAEVRCRS